MLDEGIIGNHALKLLNGDKMIMLAIDLPRTLLARRVRDRNRHTLGIVHEGMQQAGLAGAGGSGEDEKNASVHWNLCAIFLIAVIFTFL